MADQPDPEQNAGTHGREAEGIFCQSLEKTFLILHCITMGHAVRAGNPNPTPAFSFTLSPMKATFISSIEYEERYKYTH